VTTTTPTYPQLPACDARQPHETAEAYGARVLRHVLTTGCTATVDDDGLQRASWAYRAAVACKLTAAVAEQLASVDRQLAAAQRVRLQLAQLVADVAQNAPANAPACPRNDDRPSGGQLTQLQPRPLSGAPSGSAVPDWADGRTVCQNTLLPQRPQLAQLVDDPF